MMKLQNIFAIILMILLFSSCGKDPGSLSAIKSESFPEKQVQLYSQPGQLLNADSLINNDLPVLSNEQHGIVNQLDEMLLMTEFVRKTESDSVWHALNRKWAEFNTNNFANGSIPFSPNILSSNSHNIKLFPEAIRKWAELNIDLVKLSGEVRFGDALEELWYDPDKANFPETLVKSVVYTHIFDQIFINIICSSSVDYRHTTGGNVRIIQKTNYPQGNEMILKSECSDFRYMDIFIRIPTWAINPTVTHGNVKYVARPGEYCQISRKWKTGDEIRVALKN